MYDYDQASEFIRALTGDENSHVHFQMYFDPKKEHGLMPTYDARAEEWCAPLSDSNDYIDFKQNAYCGLYVCINETDTTGREEHNIIKLRTFMADFDGQEEPSWDLTPHLIQKRDDTHGHAFWFIEDNDLTNDKWSEIQRRIALYYNTDKQVVDPCRVIRVPGSIHYKNPNNPQCYYITSNISETLPRYTPDRVIDAHPLPADKDAELSQWSEQRKGLQEGVGYDNSVSEINKTISFLTNAALPAVEGSGTHEVFRVAAYGHDHGINLETMTELMWQHYNPRCEPPWGNHERSHFEGCIHRAYKYATSAPGCKTFKATLNSLPPLQEPDCDWTNMKEAVHGPSYQPEITTLKYELKKNIDRGHRMSADEAAVVGGSLTAKSGHYDFANVFDGLCYDGINLIRSNGQFYRYNGVHWEKVEDDVIKANVQRKFSIFKPSDTVTRGIYKVFSDLVNVENAENGTFPKEPNRDASNIVVFQNGMVDMARDDIVINEHTPEFFNLNALDHDYNPSATCPEWHNFLESIWDDNQVLKDQLKMWFGYCLTADVSLQKFAILKGKSRAGKGVITDILTAIVGKNNMAAPSLDKLSNDSTLSQLSKASLCLIPDAHSVNSNNRDASLSTFKAITGGDAVSYHEIYKGGRNLVMKAKVVMSTNNMPQFNDPSGALVNRALVFPFWKSFADKQDVHLRSKLLAEIEGIMNWAIEGLKMLRANNHKFIESDESLAEKKEIKDDLNPLSGFIKEMCVMDANEKIKLHDMYSSYRIWAMSSGYTKPATITRFRQMLRDTDLNITHENDMFFGITLNSSINTGNVSTFPPVRR